MSKTYDRDIILCVGKIYPYTFEAIEAYEKAEKRTFQIFLMCDQKQKDSIEEKKLSKIADKILSCNTKSAHELEKILAPYRNRIFTVCVRGEVNIPLFRRILPHIPYIKTATPASLTWSTDKLLMRRRMMTYDKKITPKYTIVQDATQKSLTKIEKQIGFPLIVKPSAMAASKLISICYHKDELQVTLKKIFRSVNSVNKKNKDTINDVIVEQFMEGHMYSIDAYVNSRGKVYFCPLVDVQTGKSIGFDDFFGYKQMTPTILKKKNIDAAEEVATKAIHALSLRSTTVHIELMRMEQGWKVIELSPRMGGFRHLMYEYSFGIDHVLNDMLIHIPKKPIVPRRRRGYTISMKFFAPKEGRLIKLTGIKKIQELKSFKEININKKIGDQCRFAKNNGTSVFNLIMFNRDRSKLLADIRRAEQMVHIQTEKLQNKTTTKKR